MEMRQAYTMKLYTMCQCKYILVFLKLIIMCVRIDGVRWDNDVYLNNDYRMLWTIDGQEMTIEVQVRTLGYVGLGFSNDGELAGADVAIGWVFKGSPYFQDRHVKRNAVDMEPVVDPAQDYVLIAGYENVTHTVMRFKRKLDTCDATYDIPISNDTMRVIFMYHDKEPQRGLVIPGNLPDPTAAFKGYRSLFLMQKPHQPEAIIDVQTIRTMELRNQDVELPQGDDTLYWCKMFKLDDIDQKSHVVKYEPVFDSSASMPFMQHIILYECQTASPELELMSREQGRPCFRPNNPPLSCNAIVATWAKGSEGFTFPPQAGYVLDTTQARFYLMETHYYNPKSGVVRVSSGGAAKDTTDDSGNATRQKADNSGLKLYYTSKLRKHDAGVLSIGMDPNWRHIIPPFHERVVSEGHCIEDCTRKAFPRQGISIFAVMMRTHMIGKEIKLRHMRNNEEFAPIAHDRNVDPNYQEYRRLPNAVRTMPGDRLTSECTYDSSSRDQITLGGPNTREESCIVLTYYYPRQVRLTTCHSLPSLPTVLHSLGIEELALGSNPVLIASPAELAGMTLESRLVTYDWKNQFDSFQQVTRQGSFKAICWDARNTLIPGTESIEGHNLNITKSWRPPTSECATRSNTKYRPKQDSRSSVGTVTDRGQSATFDSPIKQLDNDGAANDAAATDDTNGNDDASNDDVSSNIIEGAARSKVSRSSSTETMGLSGSSGLSQGSFGQRLVYVGVTLMFTLRLVL